MKKSIVSIILILVFNVVNAQKDIKYGVKVGFNVSTLTGDLPDPSYKPGMLLGVLASFPLTEKISLQPEILYSAQGGTYKTQGGTYAPQGYEETADITTDYSLNLGYIVIPVMGQYHFSNFSLEFGPQISFLTFAKEYSEIVATYNDIIAVETNTVSVKDETKSIDFGLNFGAAYDFSKHVTLNLRYNLGFDNVIKDTNGMTQEAKNSVFSLALAFKI